MIDSLSRTPPVGHVLGRAEETTSVGNRVFSVVVVVTPPRRGRALPIGELVKALVTVKRERRRAMVVFILLLFD